MYDYPHEVASDALFSKKQENFSNSDPQFCLFVCCKERDTHWEEGAQGVFDQTGKPT